MKTTTNIQTTITPAHSDNSVTRERRHAWKDGAMIDLDVYRDRGALSISWSVNRGNGWSKRWIRRGMDQAQASAFMNEKWTAMMAWITDVVPVSSGGAAAAFSAQVATVR